MNVWCIHVSYCGDGKKLRSNKNTLKKVRIFSKTHQHTKYEASTLIIIKEQITI
jgi:hypothetical protein